MARRQLPRRMSAFSLSSSTRYRMYGNENQEENGMLQSVLPKVSSNCWGMGGMEKECEQKQTVDMTRSGLR